MQASESTPPEPPGSGGNLKYALLGLLLLGGAVVVYLMTRPGDEPEPVAAAAPDAGVEERVSAIAQGPQLVLEEEPDAGPPAEAEVEDVPAPRRRAARSSWNCVGNISPQALQRTVANQKRQVRACYERRLKADQSLQGQLLVRLRINRAGKVDAVQAGGTLRDAEVVSCVRTLARSWSFPAVEGGSCAIVEAPFNLTPRP